MCSMSVLLGNELIMAMRPWIIFAIKYLGHFMHVQDVTAASKVKPHLAIQWNSTFVQHEEVMAILKPTDTAP